MSSQPNEEPREDIRNSLQVLYAVLDSHYPGELRPDLEAIRARLEAALAKLEAPRPVVDYRNATLPYKDVRRDPDGTMNVPDHPMSKYERLAAKTRGRDWRATFEGPLHGETYQRQGRGHWVLVERNQGFA